MIKIRLIVALQKEGNVTRSIDMLLRSIDSLARSFILQLALSMAKEETAYDVLRPFLTLINLYGVNWRSERRTKWRVVKFITATWWTIWFTIILTYSNFTIKKGETKIINTLDSLTFYTCLVLWKEMEELVGQLKTSRVDPTSKETQRVKRWAKVLLICLYLFATCFTFIAICMLINKVVNDYVTYDIRSNVKITVGIIAGIITGIIAGIIVALSWLMTMNFIFFVPFFLCFLTFYMSATIDDSVQRVKQCKSPLRRAKAFTKLMTSYTQLSQMTTTADHFASFVMYIFKVMATLQLMNGSFWAVRHLLELKYGLTIDFFDQSFCFGLTLILLYYWYLRLASTVNSKVSFLMSELTKVWLTDDQWLSRDPTSRCHLLEMRMNQLIELRHVMIVESASFTFLGEPIDGESLFTLCAEMVDTGNAMSSKYNNISS